MTDIKRKDPSIGLYKWKEREFLTDSLEHKHTATKINVFEPHFFQMSHPDIHKGMKQKLMSLYWYVISKGKYKIYYVSNQDKVTHFSYCLPKSYKFSFMKEKDLHIGPCVTDSAYRGRGLFPMVLTKIVTENKPADFYMIIDQDNIASQKGVAKVGFQIKNGLTVHPLFKSYKVKNT